MATKTRWLVSYESKDPAKPERMTFGVWASKYNQAITITGTFIYSRELHDSKEYDYVLDAKPSNDAATYEIPDDDEDHTVVVADESYNIDE